jgi:hypothetical protein
MKYVFLSLSFLLVQAGFASACDPVAAAAVGFSSFQVVTPAVATTNVVVPLTVATPLVSTAVVANPAVVRVRPAVVRVRGIKTAKVVRTRAIIRRRR